MKLTASDRSSLIRIASELPVGSPERQAILASLTASSEKGAGSSAGLGRMFEENKKNTTDAIISLLQFIFIVEKESVQGVMAGADLKAVKRRVMMALDEINKSLPILEMAVYSDPTTKLAAVKAEEPYKEVEGHPYTLRGGKPDTIKGVTNEKQLRDLSKLLDEAYGKMTPALEKKLSRYGVSPRGIEDLASGGGGYMLYLTDASGEEYDVYNDLGI